MTSLYVGFVVAGTEYALAASDVLELEAFSGATEVPSTLPHVEGIVAVRGKVMPVLDLRTLFGQERVAPTRDTRVLVTRRGARVVALRVDSAREVLKLEPSQFQSAPALAAHEAAAYVSSVCMLGQRLLLILALSRLLGEEDEHHDDEQRRLIPNSSATGPHALPSRGDR
ncbi:MAG TPA: chemotaxis protein CheW [Polyangiaceae bacterium]|nr:chemotaxis protein CheW [Polyangiaceae bacterium]